MMAVKADAPRPGFSLVEVLVAMVLLSVILLALAGMTFRTAQRSVELAEVNARQGLMLREVNRLTVTPWGDLPAQAGCDSISAGNHRFQRCVSLGTVSSNRRQVILVMSSARLPRPDTLVFVHSAPVSSNPLNTMQP